jgi:hypothetical protein
MTSDEFAYRKRLTFEQAEGAAPLPTQLALKTLSKDLRARLWAAVYHSISEAWWPARMYGQRPSLGPPWDGIFYEMHVYRDGRMADDFGNDPAQLVAEAKAVFEKGNYVAVFGWLQWVLRRKDVPYGLAHQIEEALEQSGAAYRLIDRDTIAPIGSAAEKASLEDAFADLAAAEFHGARSHLQNAATELTAGRYSDSVRESIHAVESVARVLEPSAELSKALGLLEKSAKIHGGLKRSFSSLYGYTSDEKGIRHPLLDDTTSKVDEVDALFMIGACASFVSYLINKARVAGLLENRNLKNRGAA